MFGILFRFRSVRISGHRYSRMQRFNQRVQPEWFRGEQMELEDEEPPVYWPQGEASGAMEAARRALRSFFGTTATAGAAKDIFMDEEALDALLSDLDARLLAPHLGKLRANMEADQLFQTLEFVGRVQDLMTAYNNKFGVTLKEPILLVGKEGCEARGKGHITVSHKRILETLQGFFVVIHVKEAYSSQRCPKCGKQTEFFRDNDLRSKRCSDSDCDLSKGGFDRDDAAGCLFVVNFIYQLLSGGHRLPELSAGGKTNGRTQPE